ncbi:MAG: hypothetical protein JWN80_3114 [Microbacteriaceae bacterium]|nr:hypothetical protein [Microbacteriaceae bacterium]
MLLRRPQRFRCATWHARRYPTSPACLSGGTTARPCMSAWPHLGAGLSLSGSSLRRNVCELLLGIPPIMTRNPNREKVTAEQAAGPPTVGG